jgi:hypothetical protein
MTKPEDMNESKRTGRTPRRCAIYARYSCELSRPSSIGDKCRQESAPHDGWVVVEEWVVADREVSGRSLVGRDAMDALKKAAKTKPRPFDCILIVNIRTDVMTASITASTPIGRLMRKSQCHDACCKIAPAITGPTIGPGRTGTAT